MGVGKNRSAIGIFGILIGRLNARVQAVSPSRTRVCCQILKVLNHVLLEAVRNMLGTLLASQLQLIVVVLRLYQELLRACLAALLEQIVLALHVNVVLGRYQVIRLVIVVCIVHVRHVVVPDVHCHDWLSLLVSSVVGL